MQRKNPKPLFLATRKDPVVQAFSRMRTAQRRRNAHRIVAADDPIYDQLTLEAHRARRKKENAIPTSKRGVWIKAGEAIQELRIDPDYVTGPFDSLLDPPPSNEDEIEKVRAFFKHPIRADCGWLHKLRRLIEEVEETVGPTNPGVISLKQIYNGMLATIEASSGSV